LIRVKSPETAKFARNVDRRILRVSDFTDKRPDHTVRRPGSGRDAISAVKLSERLTADVDAWAEAHDTVRSDAIRQLVELGLSATLPGDPGRKLMQTMGGFVLSSSQIMTADQLYKPLRMHFVAVGTHGILLRHRAVVGTVGGHISFWREFS